ncbi:MAG TPA: carbohydrate-binding family 9-like protein [Cyclobacteriaceae bacterium]|nr:carbohydrate-binding family 9-like protein [Cyclobacteriaceae bacterium]
MRLLTIIILMVNSAYAQQLTISKSNDFKVNGKGDATEWAKAEWVTLTNRGGKKNYETKMKMMYSDSGVYCLFHNADDKITSTMSEDFSDLWKEDVVEIFFWTDEKFPIYFEYELSPRNFELPIIVPNLNGKFLGWRPWHYTGSRLIQHAASIQSKAWIAEFFIPFKTLAPLTNVPATKGTTWRCNMYRLDYDDGVSRWSWQPVQTNFHDYERFGTIKFQ